MMRRTKALAKMQAQCDAFNAAHTIGETIHVWTGMINKGDPVPRTIKYPAQVLSGHTAVVYVTGGGGCIALSHVAKHTAECAVEIGEVEGG